MSNHDPNEIVEATMKYDGSLGIAFLWNGDVLVTTKRRMDSEQAKWAKQWINDHCSLTEFQAGYTYMFEIIYQNNTVVVSYLFEGLVLLAISDESGYELPYEEVLHCARTMGFFMVAPRITGSYSDVLWYCGGIERSEETATPNWPLFTSGALPENEGRQEGWVVKFNDGSRQKIVYRWWKDVSKLAGLVHPQIIWLLLKHDKIKEVFGNAPNHFQEEIHRMVQAIGGKFEETLRLIESCLRSPNSEEFGDSLCDVSEWWEDCTIHYFPRTEEFALPTDDGGGNNNRLRQLLNELKPYRRHARRTPLIQFMNGRLLPVYEGIHHGNDVNLSPFYHYSKPNFLRLPILNYLYPTSPAIEGYEPGDNFKQTWCKGWKRLSMIDEWHFVQTVLQKNNDVPPFLQLPVETIVMILIYLDHASLTALAKVCVYLRQIVKSCKTNHLFEKMREPAFRGYFGIRTCSGYESDEYDCWNRYSVNRCGSP